MLGVGGGWRREPHHRARIRRIRHAGGQTVEVHESCTSEHPRAEGLARAPIRETLSGEIDGLYRFAAARVSHRSHVAEDAVQQALLIAMAHRSPPSDPPGQRAWVRGILRNVIRRSLRTARRERDRVARVAFGPSSSSAATGADDERARMVRALELAVTELDAADQALFYAFYRAGRSHAAIAADLETTAKGVEAKLYRLRVRLRAALDRGDGGVGSR